MDPDVSGPWVSYSEVKKGPDSKEVRRYGQFTPYTCASVG